MTERYLTYKHLSKISEKKGLLHSCNFAKLRVCIKWRMRILSPALCRRILKLNYPNRMVAHYQKLIVPKFKKTGSIAKKGQVELFESELQRLLKTLRQ